MLETELEFCEEDTELILDDALIGELLTETELTETRLDNELDTKDELATEDSPIEDELTFA
jgi:hypothetical protein